ncbi:MAG TPA: imidazole glycerol phosphate synthase subunit HisH [Solirubrobacteraceae bacterium]|nr:imidazole glycerol phosphate synthase subunit HisH [Solirubrobacteraceae bacterium]
MSAPGPVIGVIDYGMGNRRSVQKALESAGAQAPITRDLDDLRRCQGLVLPGVGAFPLAMGNLGELGLDELVRSQSAAGVPLLGICLGMQLLFEGSEELGSTPGLGMLPGRVTRLAAPGLPIPHIGWNEVRWARPSRLTEGLPPQGCPFYHVHSFAARPAAGEDVVATTEYGERFATIVARERVFGVQFHPEKSSGHGLRLLGSFVRLCQEARGAGDPASTAALSARG